MAQDMMKILPGSPRMNAPTARRHARGLIVSGLRKEYPTPAEPLVVLRDVSLGVVAGGGVGDRGAERVGEEHAVNILGTLDRPSAEGAAG